MFILQVFEVDAARQVVFSSATVVDVHDSGPSSAKPEGGINLPRRTLACGLLRLYSHPVCSEQCHPLSRIEAFQKASPTPMLQVCPSLPCA
jgi:hypothetical protein